MIGFSEKCEIKFGEEFGRYLIAAQDIRPGEVLLVEDVILVAPLTESDSRCSNCFSRTSAVCNKCHMFPLCNSCNHHDTFDCEFLQKVYKTDNENLPQTTTTYTILKSLLLLENPEKEKLSKALLQFETHQDERRGLDVWKEYEKTAILPLLQYGIAERFLKHKIDSDFMQRILSIFDVNAFELRSSDGDDSLRGLFPKGAILAHQCVANTIVAIDDNFQMKIYANSEIKKGEMVSVCYTNPLWSTHERQKCLQMGKYFDCKCRRCQDPTELGSYMSGIKCDSCPDGYLLCNTKWACEKCQTEMANEQVDALLSGANADIQGANGDVRNLEMLIQKYSKKFHRNHYLLIDLKQNVASILRSFCMNPMFRPGKELLERKIELCGDILEVLDIVQPGMSRLKAIALYECFTPYAELARLNFMQKRIAKDEFLVQLKRAEQMLRDSIKILLYEPPKTPEGQLAKNMLKELKDLQADIKDLGKE